MAFLTVNLTLTRTSGAALIQQMTEERHPSPSMLGTATCKNRAHLSEARGDLKVSIKGILPKDSESNTGQTADIAHACGVMGWLGHAVRVRSVWAREHRVCQSRIAGATRAIRGDGVMEGGVIRSAETCEMGEGG